MRENNLDDLGVIAKAIFSSLLLHKKPSKNKAYLSQIVNKKFIKKTDSATHLLTTEKPNLQYRFCQYLRTYVH